jgi:hypothetical protein
VVRRYAFLLLFLFAANVTAQTTLGLQLYGEGSNLRDNSLFDLPDNWRGFATQSATGELWLRWQQQGIVFEGAFAQYASEAELPRGQGRLNEFYSDFSAAGLDFSVGKKVVGSGIGYGFRPLDLIQGEDRRTLLTTRLEGVPLLQMEHIDADSSLSLTWYNHLDADEGGIRRNDNQALLRYYLLWGDLETELLLHRHEQLGESYGAGFTWVGGSALELHGALLWQPQLLRRNHSLLDSGTLLATTDPWQTVEVKEDGRALLGMTWSTLSGYTLLLEAWHDGSAMSRSEWQKLFALAADQRALLGNAPDAAVYGNLAWDSAAFQSSSLLRENAMLRLSYDGERFDPWLDILTTPEDGGYVVTVGTDYEIRQGLKLSGGLRGYGGPDDSVYGQLPFETTGFIQFSGEMVW